MLFLRQNILLIQSFKHMVRLTSPLIDLGWIDGYIDVNLIKYELIPFLFEIL